MVRNMLKFAVFGTVLSLVPTASAMTVVRKGDTLLLSGLINPGDEFKVRDALKAGPIRAIYLDSPGGFITPAVEIARDLRSRQSTTVVDAGRARCTSACTIIFAGGTQRHYLGAGFADHLTTGKVRGLGYHRGSAFGPGGFMQESGRASGQVIAAYYEFGVSQAVPLLDKARWKEVWVISSGTAIDLRIATSIRAP